MINERNPVIAEHVEHTMTHEAHREGCLAELHNASGRLDREGFWWRPTWSELRHGKRPPDSVSSEPGEWQHGWQFWASSVSDTHFRKNSVLPRCTAARQAHLRSHSGHNAGAALACAPTTPECTVPPLLFRVLLLERLQLPLPIAEATCEGCGGLPWTPPSRVPSDRSSQEAGHSHRANGGISGRLAPKCDTMHISVT